MPEYETWSVAEPVSCTGLTVRWLVPLERLQEIVGPRWAPVHVGDGQGVFGLFAVSCPDSQINGSDTGPAHLGATIVPIRAPEAPNLDGMTAWAAIPESFGEGPVLALFGRHGFLAVDARVSVDVEEGQETDDASFVIETPESRIEARATLQKETETFAPTHALVGTREGRLGVFTGPERARRQCRGSAEIEASGPSCISRLVLDTSSSRLSLDTNFRWDFRFWNGPPQSALFI